MVHSQGYDKFQFCCDWSQDLQKMCLCTLEYIFEGSILISLDLGFNLPDLFDQRGFQQHPCFVLLVVFVAITYSLTLYSLEKIFTP